MGWTRRWSTPIAGHRDTDGQRVLTAGAAVWHTPQPEGTFIYLDFHLDAITNNPGNPETTTVTPLHSLATYRSSR